MDKNDEVALTHNLKVAYIQGPEGQRSATVHLSEAIRLLDLIRRKATIEGEVFLTSLRGKGWDRQWLEKMGVLMDLSRAIEAVVDENSASRLILYLEVREDGVCLWSAGTENLGFFSLLLPAYWVRRCLYDWVSDVSNEILLLSDHSKSPRDFDDKRAVSLLTAAGVLQRGIDKLVEETDDGETEASPLAEPEILS